MIIKSVFRFIITIALLILMGIGVFDYLQNIDQNDCSMTYMFQDPEFLEIKLPSNIKTQFENYKLYLYCEGSDCAKFDKFKFLHQGHIPVLFITGNSDSHKQVRSLASISVDKTRTNKFNSHIRFHYFTMSFNEEPSALYGPVLDKQTQFTKECIKHILKLFSKVKPKNKKPEKVLLIGNSMGYLLKFVIFSI